jgi:hypothetical protein
MPQNAVTLPESTPGSWHLRGMSADQSSDRAIWVTLLPNQGSISKAADFMQDGFFNRFKPIASRRDGCDTVSSQFDTRIVDKLSRGVTMISAAIWRFRPFNEMA